jgi:hypothetical protein
LRTPSALSAVMSSTPADQLTLILAVRPGDRIYKSPVVCMV